MRTISVKASKTYDIVIGEGILDKAGAYIREMAGGRKAAIITDDRVEGLYGKRLSDSLKKKGYQTSRYVFPRGESSKNHETFISILNFLTEEQLSRSDILVALGGGVPGDLAGFAAACYTRGVPYVQIPTTLLAAVDSSVGGKTAINLSGGKNLAGAFYQPSGVLCDISILSTLPPEIYRDGCGEIIKYGIIADSSFFYSLKKPVVSQLEDAIARCVEIKRDIVGKDEFESGPRKILNFGHTAGHGIELLSDFKVPHGQAVAMGMAIAARAAYGMGLCGRDCLEDILGMLELYGLPVKTEYPAERIAAACLSDKKRKGDLITMVFPVKVGESVLKDIPVSELENLINVGLSM